MAWINNMWPSNLKTCYFVFQNLMCFSSRCLNNWRRSSLTWRSLPANTNRKSEKVHSSGFSSRKCAPPLESTLLPVRNGLNFNSTLKRVNTLPLDTFYLHPFCFILQLAKGFGQRCSVLAISIMSLAFRSSKCVWPWSTGMEVCDSNEKDKIFATKLLNFVSDLLGLDDLGKK